MDLSKLTSAPWLVVDRMHEDAEPGEAFVQFGGTTDLTTDSTMMDRNHAEFIALARNAFDVMMRRGWYAEKIEDGKWLVCVNHEGDWAGAPEGPDPFSAVMAAEQWYKQNAAKIPYKPTDSDVGGSHN